MRITELIFPSDSPKLRPGMHRNSSFSVEKLVDFVNDLRSKGKQYKEIFHRVGEEFGPDAKTYCKYNISSIIKGSPINEEFWSYPSNNDKMKELKLIISSRQTPEQAMDKLKDVLSSRQLFDVLKTLGKDEDAVPSVIEYIKQQFPNLSRELGEKEKCLRDCDGSLSPVGHDNENI